MYASMGYSSVKLRAQFVSDITALILGFQEKVHDIVLMMDANEASGPGSGVDKIMRNCNLVDAHSLSSNKTSHPATYIPTREYQDRFCSCVLSCRRRSFWSFHFSAP
jgi:hypothetical protein